MQVVRQRLIRLLLEREDDVRAEDLLAVARHTRALARACGHASAQELGPAHGSRVCSSRVLNRVGTESVLLLPSVGGVASGHLIARPLVVGASR